MTTASQLKAMIREELKEPLDYPRAGLAGEELESYNRGFIGACLVSSGGSWRTSDSQWVAEKIATTQEILAGEAYQPPMGSWGRGRVAAYEWILGELRSLDEDTVTISRARYNYLLDLEKSVAESHVHQFVCECGEAK